MNIGIDWVTHHVGEIHAGKFYLLKGERGAGKTTFVLQFLLQGLLEHQTGLLVSPQPPEGILAHARSLGTDLLPYLKNGSLFLYEIARKDAFRPVELYAELKNVVGANRVVRFALEGIGHSPVATGAGGPWTEGLADFLNKLEELKATSLITQTVPAPPAMSGLSDALEKAAEGSLLLKSTPDEAVKTLTVLKKAGAPLNDAREHKFKIEPGRGVVEAARAKGIRFPRHEDH